MRISVVATGIDAALAPEQPRPAVAAARPSADAGPRETGSGYTQPILTQNAANPPAPPRAEAATAEPVPPAAQAAESAAVKSGAFIAPRPVDPGPVRPMPVAPPGAAAGALREPMLRPKGRVPSLIERVTGVGRRPTPSPVAPRVAAAPLPVAAPRPAAAPAQPRLTPLEPGERPPASKDEDLLDIPAFLRRQAN
jgi:cell division protein FtsZ